MESHDSVLDAITESIGVKQRILDDPKTLETIRVVADLLKDSYAHEGKLLIAGNGGSAADAQHFAAEITCQYRAKRKGYPAIALHTDTSALTAWSNDYAYESAYARLVEAYGKKEDVLCVISTSGNSGNLVSAAVEARKQGMRIVGLLGKDGGRIASEKLCDVYLIVPSMSTPRIQECHTLIIHILCDLLDNYFVKRES